MRHLPLLSFTIALAAAVSLRANAADVSTCRAIPDSLQRLVCYDALPVAAATTAPAEGRIVASFSGSGMQQTHPFTVRGPWQIAWKAPSYVAIIVKNSAGDTDGMFGNAAAPNGASAYQPKPGTYFLSVSSGGPWEIEVTNVFP